MQQQQQAPPVTTTARALEIKATKDHQAVAVDNFKNSPAGVVGAHWVAENSNHQSQGQQQSSGHHDARMLSKSTGPPHRAKQSYNSAVDAVAAAKQARGDTTIEPKVSGGAAAAPPSGSAAAREEVLAGSRRLRRILVVLCITVVVVIVVVGILVGLVLMRTTTTTTSVQQQEGQEGSSSSSSSGGSVNSSPSSTTNSVPPPPDGQVEDEAYYPQPSPGYGYGDGSGYGDGNRNGNGNYYDGISSSSSSFCVPGLFYFTYKPSATAPGRRAIGALNVTSTDDEDATWFVSLPDCTLRSLVFDGTGTTAYGICLGGGSSSSIVSVDVPTGQTTFVTTFPSSEAFHGLAYNPADDHLYTTALNYYDDTNSGGSAAVLVRIEKNWTFSYVGSPLGQRVHALAFHANGTAYATTDFDAIYSIDWRAGTSSQLLTDSLYAPSHNIAFRGPTLYGIAEGTSLPLVKIDVIDGQWATSTFVKSSYAQLPGDGSFCPFQ